MFLLGLYAISPPPTSLYQAKIIMSFNDELNVLTSVDFFERVNFSDSLSNFKDFKIVVHRNYMTGSIYFLKR